MKKQHPLSDLDADIRDHIERETQDNIERGMTPEEAHYAALRKFGNTTLVSEDARAVWIPVWFDQLKQDVHHAIRMFVTNRGFALVVVVTLALGIGATTAIFSALKPILLEPLPYPEAHRITMIWELGHDGRRADGTFGMYRGLMERARSFEEIAVFKPWQPTVTGRGHPERLDGQRVSASYFQVLGVSPTLGRAFEASDDQVNGPNVIVLSDALWHRQFGGDLSIIGRALTLDGSSYLVVGVMPRDFENVLGPSAELWAPMQYGMSQGRTWGHHLHTVGRLRPGVSLEQATTELNLLGQALLDEQHPATYRAVWNSSRPRSKTTSHAT